jgi:hypothetical protein
VLVHEVIVDPRGPVDRLCGLGLGGNGGPPWPGGVDEDDLPADGGRQGADRAWQAFLRRFDIEHTFRFLKQHLGWTKPKLRDPAAADRWTWLVIAAYAQLWLARDRAADTRLPWQRPCDPGVSPPPASAGGFAASAGNSPSPPARRNPQGRAPGGPPAPGTSGLPPATTSARPSNARSPRRRPAGRKVKQKAKCAEVELAAAEPDFAGLAVKLAIGYQQ